MGSVSVDQKVRVWNIFEGTKVGIFPFSNTIECFECL